MKKSAQEYLSEEFFSVAELEQRELGMEDFAAFTQQATDFYARNGSAARRMFGFPSNATPLSLYTQYLLMLHYTSPLANNCGDIEEKGYYGMDTKAIEKKIVQMFAEKFGMGEDFWGYVTSGGSESNSCGITLAFRKNPNGILYYAQAAHYSIKKYAEQYPHYEIPCNERNELKLDALFDAIKKNYEAARCAVNLVLTHGTTQYGACDDVDSIVAFLQKNGIPYYIHMDAALFGGIPNSQKNAPLLLQAKERGVHSVSVSLHKYLGFPDVKSVFVSTQKPQGHTIDYIGQKDTTVTGSRSIPAFALYHHICEQLSESDSTLYERNIRTFAAMLEQKKIPYYLAENSNIFVIDEPSVSTCEDFQLSCFSEDNTFRRRAHIIIFPCHRTEDMQALADRLQKDLS